MTTLQKLAIWGIRSFSPEQPESLVFERPLTLIVGHNGAGKTTIVECLKMATTGELPPNSGKGQLFVHNPPAADSPEVKGQIRVVFRTSNQREILVMRSLQLTNTRDKKGKMKASFKVVAFCLSDVGDNSVDDYIMILALDSVIQVKEGGGPARSINKKCVDVDQQVPTLMGVSKAILENVIFCHQEDSNWPMQEMGKLKKKFDDLFGAARYSKALEAINNARKEHQKTGKDKLHDLEMLRALQDQAENTRRKIARSEAKDATFAQEIGELQEQLTKKGAEVDAIKQKLAAIKHVETEIAIRRRLVESLSTEVAELSKGLKEVYAEDVDQLRSFQLHLQDEIMTLKASLSQAEDETSHLEGALQENTKKVDLARHQLEEVIRSEERKKEAQRRQVELSLRLRQEFGFEAESLQLIAELKSAKEKRLQNLKESSQRNSRQLLERMSIAENVLHEAIATQKREYERAALKDEISVDKTRLAQESNLIDELRDVTASISAMAESQKKHNVELAIKEAEEELHSLRSTRQSVSVELERVTLSISGLESQTTLQAELSIQETALGKKSKQVHKEQSNLGAKYFALLGHDVGTLMPKHSHELGLEVAKELEQAQRLDSERLNKQKELGSILGKLQLLGTEIKELSNDKTKADAELRIMSIEVDQYEDILSAQKSKVENARKELLIAQNAEKLYSNYLQHSIVRNKCAFCTRRFNTPEELETLKKHLDARISQLPQAIAKSEEDLESASLHLTKLQRCQTAVCDIQRIEAMLSERESQLTILDTSVKNLQQLLDVLNMKCKASAERLTNLRELKREFEEWMNTVSEMASLKSSLEGLRKRIGADVSVPSSLSEQKSQISQLRSKLQDIEENYGLKEAQLSTLRRRFFEQLSQSSELSARRMQLEEKVSALREMEQRMRSNVSNVEQLDGAIVMDEEAVARARAEVEQLRNRMREAESSSVAAIQNALASVETIAMCLTEYEKASRRIEEADVAKERKEDGLERLKQLNLRADDLTNRLKQKRTLLGSIREDIEGKDAIWTLVEKNLLVKRKQQEIDRAKRELIKFGANVGEKENPEKLTKELEEGSAAMNVLAAQISSRSGERKSNLEYLAEYRKELSVEKFRSIDEKCQYAMIETEVELMAIRKGLLSQDLQKYHIALDKALMKYHTIKVNRFKSERQFEKKRSYKGKPGRCVQMQEINRTLRQLWQTTYKGSDIDSIAIRSDTEETIQFATTGQRSYNYRVTMLKDGVEQEMRGRCSAGQKVLASIVIRLALAESFCVSCGILALDEPTTNLDRENMEGLARALAGLIEARRDCSNFQLILITHDLEFARMLSQHQPCDFFFEVLKDAEGFSIIRRGDIRKF